ncbi:MAG: S26 family signal peptidase [Bacilli bacterium]|nr:S26 family signal peptidase [Bacilli bacterium]
MFKNKKVNQIINTTISVLLSILIIIILFFTIYAFSADQHDGIPQMFGKSYMVVLSDSMSTGNDEYDFDGFDRGDIITIKRYTWMEASSLTFEVGDIITFEAEDDEGTRIYNTHRIIEVNLIDKYYITQGDKAHSLGQSTDPAQGHAELVHFVEVVGSFEKVSARGLGNVVLFLETPTGFLICVVLPLLGFFIYEIFNFRKVFVEYRREKRGTTLTPEEEKALALQQEIARLKEELAKKNENPPAEEPKE